MSRLIINERPVLQETPSSDFPDVGYDFNKYMSGLTGVQGRSCQLHLREGLDVSGFDLVLESGEYQSSKQVEPCIALFVMLQGAGKGEVQPCSSDRTLGIPFRPRTCYISVLQERVRGSSLVPVGSTLQGVDIRFSLSFLQRLQQSDLLSRLNVQHPAHLASTDLVWLGASAINYKQEQAARYILGQIFGPPRNDLQLECQALSILSELISTLREQSQSLHHERPLTNKEKRAVESAINLIDAQLGHGWTISELARRVGINEKRLKLGFKWLTGRPVGRYIQSRRLEQAKVMISNQGLSVTEASLTVGYANPSHFTHLFKREFGHPPSAIK